MARLCKRKYYGVGDILGLQCLYSITAFLHGLRRNVVAPLGMDLTLGNQLAFALPSSNRLGRPADTFCELAHAVCFTHNE